MWALLLLLSVLALGCDGCGGSEGAGPLGGRGEEEVQRWTRWSAPGVTLYVSSSHVPDRTSSSVYGVDRVTGERVAGADLMRRFGELSAEQLAECAYGVLLARATDKPVTPRQKRSKFASEQEWAAVHEPRVEGGTLVFFGMEGEMSPRLVEYRVAMDTFEVTTRSATELLLARGEVVVDEAQWCVPVTRCGCWDGCVRAVRISVPAGQRGSHRLVGEEDTRLWLREECVGEQCFRVCRSDHPDASCDEGALAPLDEACEESCPPSEAPYHCVTQVDRCEQVAHPTRAASRKAP